MAEEVAATIKEEAPADASSKESKIPPLNPEDPLAGLTDAQVQESLATFGKNEVSSMMATAVPDCGGVNGIR